MASNLILITGASGYIGFKTLVVALEAGYRIRAVVRKVEQIQKLQIHRLVRPHVQNLEFVVVADLTKEGALDNALAGVRGIIHLASPLAIETDDYNRDIIQPALDITLSLLASAMKSTTVKRVVLTSSAVTLIPIEWLSSSDTQSVFTEDDINSNPTQPFQSPMEAYWASKAMTRMASKQFMLENNPSFDLVRLLPSVVIGRDELATSVETLLRGTRALVMGTVLGRTQDPLVGQQVDVADVAKAHVDALKSTVPGNADYILSSDSPNGIDWDSAKKVVSKNFPEAVADGRLSLGGIMPTRPWKIDTSATERAFGWKFRSYDDTVRGLVEQYLELLPNSDR